MLIVWNKQKFCFEKNNKHHEDIHKTSDIIHLLGKKVLMDGYNFKENILYQMVHIRLVY